MKGTSKRLIRTRKNPSVAAKVDQRNTKLSLELPELVGVETEDVEASILDTWTLSDSRREAELSGRQLVSARQRRTLPDRQGVIRDTFIE